MATIKLNAAENWSVPTTAREQNISIGTKLMSLADSQADHKTLWFMVSLIVQGVLFLPIPAALIYYFNAPVLIVAITLTLFFANVIAGMGGAGIRTLLAFFFGSVLIHLLMLAIFIL
ncbi:hypothetical protein [Mucilaginibacter sp.]|uniref:hypothetical protein n=1 Tax=Mucilaginibacter sp. TaxID=1882438 RepID=UPI003D0DD1F0